MATSTGKPGYSVAASSPSGVVTLASTSDPNSSTPWNAQDSEPITRKPHPMRHATEYYGKCMVGGILSCGLTHTAICPIDVVKCRIQVYPEKYRSLVSGIRTMVAEGGMRSLSLGWAPTFIGYSMQGLCKFGFYEMFKDCYANLAGEENAAKYKGAIWLTASASAEFLADIALCPMEMVKVKVQTAPAGTWPTPLVQATAQMAEQRAATRFPFGSLVPLWSRQIPYTMAKFYFFEKVVQTFYDKMFTEPKNTYSKTTQLGITFTSGYIAGVICAIVSHPADTLVSQMGKDENKGKRIADIARNVGMKNLLTKGLGTRVFMIGSLTGLQWWVYDSFKTAMGMGTTGGGSTSAVKK